MEILLLDKQHPQTFWYSERQMCENSQGGYITVKAKGIDQSYF